MGARGVEGHLARVRRGMERLSPAQLLAERAAGALVVDTRTPAHRAAQGEFPGALVIDRTVLEWRLDPTCPYRVPEATGWDLRVVLVCRHGYSSSLAAASLRAIGLSRATDLDGGVERWMAEGFAVHHGPVDLRE